MTDQSTVERDAGGFEAAEVLLVAAPPRSHSDHARWSLFAAEVLEHAGVTFRASTGLPADAEALRRSAVVVFAAPPRLTADERDRIGRWVSDGGRALTVGGAGDLGELISVADAAPIAAGRVRVELDGPDGRELPAFGGVSLVPAPSPGIATAEIAASWCGGHGSAVVTVAHGLGAVTAFGPDVWQTIVRIQQGWPVDRDGVPAADGSVPVDDGVLKCDDGIALDFDLDRRLPRSESSAQGEFSYVFPPPVSPPVFDVPLADAWTALLLERVLTTGVDADGVGVPRVDYWPDGSTAVAHISQDSDGNLPEEAIAALDVWRELGVRTTWCQLYPGGYGDDLMALIISEGHDIALHYSALGDSPIARWRYDDFAAQLAWVRAHSGAAVRTNKNHYTRWEGWAEFFQWCERLGVELDQSRGPSKIGAVGFPFGTSHLWKPLSDGGSDGRIVDVLAMPLHTQDLAHAAHESIRDVILDGAEQFGGVAHFLFHPMHIRERPVVRQACVDLVAEIRRRGLPLMTAAEINRWERSRRDARVLVRERGAGRLVVEVWSSAPITLAVDVADVSRWHVSADGAPTDFRAEQRGSRPTLLVPVRLDPASPRVTLTFTIDGETETVND